MLVFLELQGQPSWRVTNAMDLKGVLTKSQPGSSFWLMEKDQIKLLSQRHAGALLVFDAPVQRKLHGVFGGTTAEGTPIEVIVEE